jgi:hypothetical protein
MHSDNETALESAAKEKRISLPSEFLHFLKENKKWWLLPILMVLLFLSLVTFLAGTGMAAFIYPIF